MNSKSSWAGRKSTGRLSLTKSGEISLVLRFIIWSRFRGIKSEFIGGSSNFIPPVKAD